MNRYRLLALVLSVALIIVLLSGCFLFKPSAPTNLTATVLSSSSIKLSWNGNENDFIVYRSVGNPNDFKKLSEVKSTSYLDKDLSANTTYFYEIKSKNGFGLSDPSNVASAMTFPLPPNAPILTITSVSTSTISLSWTESSTIVNGFELYRSKNTSGTFTQIATIAKNETFYIDKNLESSTKYYYKMKTYNKGGESKYSNVASVKTKEVKTIPLAPSNLKVVTVTSGSITLEWDESSKDVEGFRVYRSMSRSGTYTFIADVSSTKYTNTDLEHATTYYYEVTAYNEVGESKPSNVASTTTKQEIPFNPSDLVMTSVSTNTISLKWKDNSNNEEGFKIYRSTDSTKFIQIATPTKNTTTYTDEGLKSDITYYYKVSAYNSAGESTTSNEASTKTGIWIPTAPVNVGITSYSTDSVTLKWKNTYDATTVIYRKSISHNTYTVYKENGVMMAKLTEGASSSDFTPIATLSSATNTYTDRGLEYNTTYYYKLRSHTKYGWSQFTSVASITTKNTLPKAPTNLKASASAINEITLTWKDNSDNEEGFRIWRKDDSNQAYTLIAVVKANTTMYTDTNLTPHKNYWYMVSAYNSAGNTWSNSTGSISTYNALKVRNTIWIWKPGQYGIEQGKNPSAVGVNPNTDMIYVANYSSNNVSVIDSNTNSVVTTISVGDWPDAVGVNPNTNKIYVANWGSNSVSVIDGETNSVATTISVGSGPEGIGVNASMNKIYVANSWDNSVSVIDGQTNSVATTISVGNGPDAVGVNPNTNTIYVANRSSDNVSVIDGQTNSVVKTILVGDWPDAVGVNPNTNTIYVANYYSDSVSVIDGNTNSVVTTISVGSGPEGVGVNASTNKIYVANHYSDSVSVIDGNTNSVATTISVGSGPEGIGVNPNTNKIYVANHYSDSVSVIDGNTNSVVTTIPVGDYPQGIGVNASTNKIYVANHNSDSVSVIDGNTNSVATTISVGSGPAGIGVNPNTNKIYVTNESDNSVSVIDGNTNSVVTTISVGGWPDAVGVNPNTNTIYVANSWDNSVSVIDGNTNSVATTISVGSGPDAVGVNPNTNTIYVANYNSNSVSVIDGQTNSVATTIPVGDYPQGIGVNPNTNTIYVANYNSNSVSVIDGETNSVVKTILVGDWPDAVGVNPITNKVYVANEGDGSISVIY